MDSKKLATSAHQILKEMGHNVSLGHVYELFSKLSGHKSWNVAKTKGGFQPVINTVMTTTLSVGSGNFEVKVTAEVESGMNNLELKKYYRVRAQSAEEAEKIVNAYIDYRENETESSMLVPGVGELLYMESEEDYRTKNWELIYFNADIKVQQGSTSKIKARDGFAISALTSDVLGSIQTICQKVVSDSTPEDKNAVRRFETLLQFFSTRKGVIYSADELTLIISIVESFASSVSLGVKKGIIDQAANHDANYLMAAILDAKKEAEEQGYTYPGSFPNNVTSLN